MDKSEQEKGVENWDFPQERAFLENLLCQRFNFLLVFYGLIVAGAITCQEQLHLQILLGIGAVITSLISVTIAGVQWKLDLTLDKIFSDKHSPITYAHRVGSGLSLRWIIGYVIPAIFSLSLLVSEILAITNLWKAKTGG